MIPQQRIQPLANPVAFLGARASSDIGFTLDYEDGGIALQDPSAGLLFQAWMGVIINDGSIVLSAPTVAPTTVITGIDITEFSFTFDQNMNPAIAYVDGGDTKLYWFDTIANAQVTTTFGPDYKNPRVALDDKHRLAGAISDVIFAYLRGGSLYYRQQRDRYLTEYLLASGVQGRLNRIGLNENNRFQFELVIE